MSSTFGFKIAKFNQKMLNIEYFIIHSRKKFDDFWLNFWSLSGAKVCEDPKERGEPDPRLYVVTGEWTTGSRLLALVFRAAISRAANCCMSLTIFAFHFLQSLDGINTGGQVGYDRRCRGPRHASLPVWYTIYVWFRAQCQNVTKGFQCFVVSSSPPGL